MTTNSKTYYLAGETDDKLIYQEGFWKYKSHQKRYEEDPENFMWDLNEDTKQIRLIPTFKPV